MCSIKIMENFVNESDYAYIEREIEERGWCIYTMDLGTYHLPHNINNVKMKTKIKNETQFIFINFANVFS